MCRAVTKRSYPRLGSLLVGTISNPSSSFLQLSEVIANMQIHYRSTNCLQVDIKGALSMDKAHGN